jgi:hypothetical protein
MDELPPAHDSVGHEALLWRSPVPRQLGRTYLRAYARRRSRADNPKGWGHLEAPPAAGVLLIQAEKQVSTSQNKNYRQLILWVH